MSGFILLHRKLTAHSLYQAKPFCEFAAWVDLLFQASYTETEKLGYGQLLVSDRYLAGRWGWEKTRVRRFLARLESEKSVSVERTTHRTGNSTTRRTAPQTLITIVNYAEYQGKQRRRDAVKAKLAARVAPARAPQAAPILKQSETSTPSESINTLLSRTPIAFVDPDSGENRLTEWLKLTAEERQSLLNTFGHTLFNRELAAADDWCANRAKRFKELKDHAAFLRSWMRKSKTSTQRETNSAPLSKAQAKRQREHEAMRRVCEAFEGAESEQEQSASLIRLLGGAP